MTLIEDRASEAPALPNAARLARLMRARANLGPPFDEVWRAMSRHHSADALEPWAGAVLRLIDVNAGPTCLLAFWQASKELGELPSLCAAAEASAVICRRAGAQAAAQALGAYPRATSRFGAAALDTWWTAMLRLAGNAPESLPLVCERIDILLAAGDAVVFAAFIATGLRIAGDDKAKRAAFFSLKDPLARRLLEGSSAGSGFTEQEAELKAFLTALWGSPPSLRGFSGGAPGTARRANIAGPLVRLPEAYRGVRGEASRLLFRAAAAHASAHLMLGRGRFKVGTLKPLQLALVGLIEDARIEALAMRRYPGLRRLWAPYHIAESGGVPTAASLLARISRGLFDPTYLDDDMIVTKARALFAAAMGRLDDPTISREIGGRLGNDIGQRRIQFDAKGHVVEPLYRDDGFGLWDFEEEDASAAEEIELAVEAARIERRETADAPPPPDDEASEAEPAGRARPVAPDQRGTLVATYPEWDEAERILRPDWTSVRATPAALGDVRPLADALDAAQGLRARVARLVRGAKVGRTQRLRRQAEGHDLDLDAVIDSAIAQRGGEAPDGRVFRSSALRQRDLAVLVLIDVSESTRARLSSPGPSVLEIETLAVAVLAEAMQALGDRFALAAFASAGREEVRVATVKPFDEPYGRASTARLAGLKSGLSTRLGAVLRHAGAELEGVRSFRKLVLVLTDGEPSDIDVRDPAYLTADARHAVLGLKARGIDTFGVTLDPEGVGSSAAIFGRAGHVMVRRVEELPARLAELYFRLARR
jgi:hypothetical protein